MTPFVKVHLIQLGESHNNKFLYFALNSIVLGTSVPSAVPEPGTMMLMGSGVLGMLAFRRRELLAYFRK